MSAPAVSTPHAVGSDLWIDPDTGLIVEPETDGAVKIEQWDVAVPVEAEALVEKEDFSWLPAWYLKRQAHVAAERATLMAQYKKKMARLDAIDRHMLHRWSEPLSKVVADDISKQKGKKRSFDYLEGRAGFRMLSKCEITDEVEAMEWAVENCPAAIKVSQRLLVSELPKMRTEEKIDWAEVPGVRRWKEERFFAKGNIT